MSLPTIDDTAERLLALAHAAAPSVHARPDLARTVLGRIRRYQRARRLRHLALGFGGGVLVLGTLAAGVLAGRSDYYTITQPSAIMADTVQIGEQVILNRSVEPARGDVVQIHVRADGREYDSILRIVAMPGDTVVNAL